MRLHSTSPPTRCPTARPQATRLLEAPQVKWTTCVPGPFVRRLARVGYTERWPPRCERGDRERPSAAPGWRRNQLPARPRFHHTVVAPSGDRALVPNRRSRICQKKLSRRKNLHGREDQPGRRVGPLGPAATPTEPYAPFGNCSHEA